MSSRFTLTRPLFVFSDELLSFCFFQGTIRRETRSTGMWIFVTRQFIVWISKLVSNQQVSKLDVSLGAKIPGRGVPRISRNGTRIPILRTPLYVSCAMCNSHTRHCSGTFEQIKLIWLIDLIWNQQFKNLYLVYDNWLYSYYYGGGDH